nr:uncharacterized protein LOC127337610 [Lolium perenne]
MEVDEWRTTAREREELVVHGGVRVQNLELSTSRGLTRTCRGASGNERSSWRGRAAGGLAAGGGGDEHEPGRVAAPASEEGGDELEQGGGRRAAMERAAAAGGEVLHADAREQGTVTAKSGSRAGGALRSTWKGRGGTASGGTTRGGACSWGVRGRGGQGQGARRRPPRRDISTNTGRARAPSTWPVRRGWWGGRLRTPSSLRGGRGPRRRGGAQRWRRRRWAERRRQRGGRSANARREKEEGKKEAPAAATPASGRRRMARLRGVAALAASAAWRRLCVRRRRRGIGGGFGGFGGNFGPRAKCKRGEDPLVPVGTTNRMPSDGNTKQSFVPLPPDPNGRDKSMDARD